MTKQSNDGYGDFHIAGLNVRMEVPSELADTLSLPYRATFMGQPDLVLEVPAGRKSMRPKDRAACSDEFDFLDMGKSFYMKLLDFEGLYLHASAVVLDGMAYLFSAPPGTGKSTHTRLWVKHFGQDRAAIINDDSPAIRRVDGRFMAYGTPWSGGTRVNRNAGAPLQGIALLQRAENNSIRLINPEESLPLLLSQTLFTGSPEQFPRFLNIIEKLVKDVPVFRLDCNMDESAAVLAHETMLKGFSQ